MDNTIEMDELDRRYRIDAEKRNTMEIIFLVAFFAIGFTSLLLISIYNQYSYTFIGITGIMAVLHWIGFIITVKKYLGIELFS